jgi:type II secretory pathway pseudopilin PulG
MRTELNRCKSPAPRSGSDAFTSIELLVVIAMLFVLAAIVFPALARSKERDIRVVCMSNEKQLYTSVHIYCDDNGDKLPLIQGGASWPWDLPSAATAPMLGSGCTKKTFYCPSTAPRFTDQENWAAQNSLWNFGAASSYSITGYIFAFGGNGSQLASQYQNRTILTEAHTSGPVTAMDSPGTRELMADVIVSINNILPASAADNFSSISGGFMQNGATYPHLSAHLGKGQIPAGGNIAYKDGHVAWKKFNASTASATVNPSKIRTSGAPYFWW